jgi:hypothetical protein
MCHSIRHGAEDSRQGADGSGQERNGETGRLEVRRKRVGGTRHPFDPFDELRAGRLRASRH